MTDIEKLKQLKMKSTNPRIKKLKIHNSNGITQSFKDKLQYFLDISRATDKLKRLLKN